MGLVVDVLLLAFLIHPEDLVLPLLVVTWYPYADVGDDMGVFRWDPLSYSMDQNTLVAFIFALACELGFSLQLAEVDVGRIAAHRHLLHALLVDLLNGGVMELFMEQAHEEFPSGVPIAWTSFVVFIVVWQDVPVGVAEVDPPILRGSWFEEGGGEDHHLRMEGKILPEHLKVCLAVPQESVNVIMFPFELGRDWE